MQSPLLRRGLGIRKGPLRPRRSPDRCPPPCRRRMKPHVVGSDVHSRAGPQGDVELALRTCSAGIRQLPGVQLPAAARAQRPKPKPVAQRVLAVDPRWRRGMTARDRLRVSPHHLAEDSTGSTGSVPSKQLGEAAQRRGPAVGTAQKRLRRRESGADGAATEMENRSGPARRPERVPQLHFRSVSGTELRCAPPPAAAQPLPPPAPPRHAP